MPPHCQHLRHKKSYRDNKGLPHKLQYDTGEDQHEAAASFVEVQLMKAQLKR